MLKVVSWITKVDSPVIVAIKTQHNRRQSMMPISKKSLQTHCYYKLHFSWMFSFAESSKKFTINEKMSDTSQLDITLYSKQLNNNWKWNRVQTRHTNSTLNQPRQPVRGFPEALGHLTTVVFATHYVFL